MPKPIAICIEDLGSEPKTRYLRCVALPGRQPGLRLDKAGSVLWQSDDGVSCELWVSADERLILYRPEAKASGPVTLHRAGRSLDVPFGKSLVSGCHWPPQRAGPATTGASDSPTSRLAVVLERHLSAIVSAGRTHRKGDSLRNPGELSAESSSPQDGLALDRDQSVR